MLLWTLSRSGWSETVERGRRTLTGDLSRLVPPARRGFRARADDLSGGLGGTSGTPPERLRAFSALACPHGVTHFPGVGQSEQV
jgi:hypothetical protein